MNALNPNIRWFHYPLKPIAWIMLLIADMLIPIGHHNPLNVTWMDAFRSNRRVTNDKWRQCWPRRHRKIVRISWLQSFRPFHWFPRTYAGVNGTTTKLLVIGWIGIEYQSCPSNPA